MARFAAVAIAAGFFLSRWIDPEQPVTVIGWVATVLGVVCLRNARDPCHDGCAVRGGVRGSVAQQLLSARTERSLNGWNAWPSAVTAPPT
jgi:uncharacterized membrane protein YfcA